MEKHEPLMIRLEFTTEESAALLAASSHYVMYAKQHPELELQEAAFLLEDLQRKLVEQVRAASQHQGGWCVSQLASPDSRGATMTEDASPIFFYKVEEKYGCFSNFFPCNMVVGAGWWPTVEHYFQSEKFAGTPYAETIRQAASPKEAAKLGREHTFPIRPDWELIRDEVMYRGVLSKFQMSPSLRNILLKTGSRLLIEDNQEDEYWGCGKDGKGKNKLGQILMRVRAELLDRLLTEESPH